MKVCPFSWWSNGYRERIHCAGVAGHSDHHRGRASGDRSADRSYSFVAVGAEFDVPDGRWYR